MVQELIRIFTVEYPYYMTITLVWMLILRFDDVNYGPLRVIMKCASVSLILMGIDAIRTKGVGKTKWWILRVIINIIIVISIFIKLKNS